MGIRVTTRAGVVHFDVGDLAADIATVEALARLALVTRRAGCPLALRRVSPELERLVAFCGLSAALGVEPRGKPEQREQPRGVQERVEPRDPPA
jgi:hypothetical protein